ncbi:MAG: flagellar basal body L-ring protein FlgH [Planctomycetota bacterium]|jgi:flagellar L-ring protein precursor FlgH
MTASPARRLRHRTSTALMTAACLLLVPASLAAAQSRTLVGQAVSRQVVDSGGREPHLLYDTSIFAVDGWRPRVFRKHDLVQVIVQEQAAVSNTQEMETGKEYTLDGGITAWPQLSLADIAQLQLFAGRTTGLPSVGVDLEKEFTSDGEYTSANRFTTRLTAEVIEILPNGNIVLEARTSVRNDSEVATITVTGICRGEDVTLANTILSHQLHDLQVERRSEGRLPEANKKGLVTQFFDLLFAF